MEEEQYLRNLFKKNPDIFWKYIAELKKFYDHVKTAEAMTLIGDIDFLANLFN